MDFNIRDRRAIFNLAKGWDKEPSRLHRMVQWVDGARVNGNRKVLALVVGGGAVVSLGVGMMLGGALEGIDVALPPPAHPGPGPIIDYASPTTGPHAHQHASRPATAAAGNKRSSTSTTNASPPDTTTTAVLTGTVSTSPTTTKPAPPPSSTTTTQPPPGTPTTTTPPGGGGSGGQPPNPLQNFLQQLSGG